MLLPNVLLLLKDAVDEVAEADLGRWGGRGGLAHLAESEEVVGERLV